MAGKARAECTGGGPGPQGGDDEGRSRPPLPRYRDRCGKKRTLAHVYGGSPGERDANARMIALAPRMAETLRGLLAYADAALAGEAGDLDAVRGARAIVRELDGGVVP